MKAVLNFNNNLFTAVLKINAGQDGKDGEPGKNAEEEVFIKEADYLLLTPVEQRQKNYVVI